MAYSSPSPKLSDRGKLVQKCFLRYLAVKGDVEGEPDTLSSSSVARHFSVDFFYCFFFLFLALAVLRRILEPFFGVI